MASDAPLAAAAAGAAPQADKEVDKLGARVFEYIKQYRETDTPLELKPHQVGVHPLNRGGADPNMLVVHHKILASFRKDGYDASRHLTPIVVRCSSDEARQKLQAHNKRFAEGRTGFPSVDEKAMEFGTLAGSHLTIALRCVESDVPCLSTGFGSKAIADSQAPLKLAAQRGLAYWVLKEDTPLSVLSDISQWRNQDQNSNQPFHEMELLVLVTNICRTSIAASSAGKINASQVCAVAQRQAPVKLSSRVLQGVVRYALQYFSAGQSSLLTDLTRWHSANIDPQELCLPTSAFDTTGNVIKFPSLQDAPLTRLYVIKAMYDKETAVVKQRPQPDVASLISNTELESFLNKKHSPQWFPRECVAKSISSHLKAMQKSHALPRERSMSTFIELSSLQIAPLSCSALLVFVRCESAFERTS